jgi:FMN phosphatase YigB (HAD superfamily)
VITTVLFDFYNTLYSAHEWFHLEVRGLPSETLKVLRGRGWALTPEQAAEAVEAYRRVREQVHSSGKEVMAEDGLATALTVARIPVPDDLPGIVAELQRDAYRPGREEPGMVECVRALAARGYTLGIVSNALCQDFLHWSLADTGIAGCFSGVYASATVGYYKSSPRLYEVALADLGARAAESVHVGDSYRFDVLGSKAAGLRAVWYAPGGEAELDAEADAVVRSLSDLPAALRRLQGTTP